MTHFVVLLWRFVELNCFEDHRAVVGYVDVVVDYYEKRRCEVVAWMVPLRQDTFA